MTMTAKPDTARICVIVNPGSGRATSAHVREALGRRGMNDPRKFRLHELTPGENLREAARLAALEGFDIVAAAGGDGTTSQVANGLIGTKARLGIIPLGTTNVLARELGIPLDLEQACSLLSPPHQTARIDAMKVGDVSYFTQIGIGLDAEMIRDTTTERKKRLGVLAYLIAAIRRLIGFQPHRFTITVDDQTRSSKAMLVVLANCGTVGVSPLKWAPGARPDDGRIDVCLIRSRSPIDLLRLGFDVLFRRSARNNQVKFLTAQRRATIAAEPPVSVQGDGELIGETPINVEIVPGALWVIVPPGSPWVASPVEASPDKT